LDIGCFLIKNCERDDRNKSKIFELIKGFFFHPRRGGGHRIFESLEAG
jgi:hypothetical protein